MSNRYAPYSRLKIEYPAERILRVTFDRPETFNSVDAETHTQLTNIWRDINDDPDVNAVIVTAEQDTRSSPATAAMRGE